MGFEERNAPYRDIIETTKVVNDITISTAQRSQRLRRLADAGCDYAALAAYYLATNLKSQKNNIEKAVSIKRRTVSLGRFADAYSLLKGNASYHGKEFHEEVNSAELRYKCATENDIFSMRDMAEECLRYRGYTERFYWLFLYCDAASLPLDIDDIKDTLRAWEACGSPEGYPKSHSDVFTEEVHRAAIEIMKFELDKVSLPELKSNLKSAVASKMELACLYLARIAQESENHAEAINYYKKAEEGGSKLAKSDLAAETMRTLMEENKNNPDFDWKRTVKELYYELAAAGDPHAIVMFAEVEAQRENDDLANALLLIAQMHGLPKERAQAFKDRMWSRSFYSSLHDGIQEVVTQQQLGPTQQ